MMMLIGGGKSRHQVRWMLGVRYATMVRCVTLRVDVEALMGDVNVGIVALVFNGGNVAEHVEADEEHDVDAVIDVDEVGRHHTARSRRLHHNSAGYIPILRQCGQMWHSKCGALRSLRYQGGVSPPRSFQSDLGQTRVMAVVVAMNGGR
eukprot:4315027-Amphidinium_carterae.1